MRTLGEIYVPSVENFVLSDGILFSSDETFFSSAGILAASGLTTKDPPNFLANVELGFFRMYSSIVTAPALLCSICSSLNTPKISQNIWTRR